MHTTSSFLFLSLLFSSLCCIANAYPRRQSLAVRVVPNVAGTLRIDHQTRPNGSRPNNRKKKEKEDLPGEREQQDHDTEVPESGDDESSIDDIEDGGTGKCSVPLTQHFAARLEDGHGCKKIAEAFNNCGARPQFFCADTRAQKNCLCDQTEKFSDALVKSCHTFLVAQNYRASRRLEPYVEDEGICGF
ncbi:MAG: hypothetical protein Q9169_001363 [Polycauliona sp. 2 TL-2023]